MTEQNRGEEAARKGRVSVELVAAVKNAEEQVMRNEDVSDAHVGAGMDANGPSRNTNASRSIG